MSTDAPIRTEPDQGTPAPSGPPQMRTLSLTVLSLLMETAAAHLGTPLPGDPAEGTARARQPNLAEARLAIDAATGVLNAVAASLDREERLAIEGLLAQLQVEFVKKTA